MATYDSKGNFVASPIAKGEKKSRGKVNEPSKKIVKKNTTITDKRSVAEVALAETKVKKPTGGAGPRQSGNRVERLVAKKLGGDRTPGSGAWKNTNRNLTGDVEIPDDQGRNFIKLEVKASGAVTAGGEKSYTINKGVLAQMQREADEAHELGVLIFHFKGENIDNSWAVMSMATLEGFIEDAKFARTARL